MNGFQTPKKPFSLDEVDWAYLDSLTDEQINAGIAADPDAVPELDDEWFAGARLVLPETKTPLSLRVDSDVFRAFQGTGTGYQQRMNEALRDYAVRQGWVAAEPDRPAAKRGRPRKIARG